MLPRRKALHYSIRVVGSAGGSGGLTGEQASVVRRGTDGCRWVHRGLYLACMGGPQACIWLQDGRPFRRAGAVVNSHRDREFPFWDLQITSPDCIGCRACTCLQHQTNNDSPVNLDLCRYSATSRGEKGKPVPQSLRSQRSDGWEREEVWRKRRRLIIRASLVGV